MFLDFVLQTFANCSRDLPKFLVTASRTFGSVLGRLAGLRQSSAEVVRDAGAAGRFDAGPVSHPGVAFAFIDEVFVLVFREGEDVAVRRLFDCDQVTRFRCRGRFEVSFFHLCAEFLDRGLHRGLADLKDDAPLHRGHDSRDVRESRLVSWELAAVLQVTGGPGLPLFDPGRDGVGFISRSSPLP